MKVFLTFIEKAPWKMLPFGGNTKGDEVEKKKSTGVLGNSNYAINHSRSLNALRVASAIRGSQGGEGRAWSILSACVQGKKSHLRGIIARNLFGLWERKIWNVSIKRESLFEIESDYPQSFVFDFQMLNLFAMLNFINWFY